MSITIFLIELIETMVFRTSTAEESETLLGTTEAQSLSFQGAALLSIRESIRPYCFLAPELTADDIYISSVRFFKGIIPMASNDNEKKKESLWDSKLFQEAKVLALSKGKASTDDLMEYLHVDSNMAETLLDMLTSIGLDEY